MNAFNGLDTLPGFQNVASPGRKLVTAAARLNYGYVLDSLGHVDDEKGIRWNLNLLANSAGGVTVPVLYGGVDFGVRFCSTIPRSGCVLPPACQAGRPQPVREFLLRQLRQQLGG